MHKDTIYTALPNMMKTTLLNEQKLTDKKKKI